MTMLVTTTVQAVGEKKSPPKSEDVVVNPSVLASEYACRGAITTRAAEIEKELRAGGHGYSFDKVLYCNIGNPQSLNQKPLTYGRRVVACCECIELADSDIFPKDVVQRSRQIHDAMPIGAYTDSVGNRFVRELVAQGISTRDGHEASPDDIFMSDGASAIVHFLLSAMIKDSRDAFLVPIPQYPLYSAALTLYGGTLVPYYLDEDKGWALDVDGITTLIRDSQQAGLRIRGIVVINPGNPTGQLLSIDNQVQLVEVCAKAGVPIIADEVYQQNVWADGKYFTSFRKVALDNPQPVAPVILSLHSTSKGFLGECGHRGGYMDALNCPQLIRDLVMKLMSISLCSNTVGQVMMAALMAPPAPGDASYDQHQAETTAILASLKRRSTKMVEAVRKLEGVTCCDSEGALYVFPRLTMPPGAAAAAAAAGVEPDFLYCLELLNETGIVTVPGSGFKQAPGTYHVRSTILPQESDIDDVLGRLSNFHQSFMSKYRS